MLRELNADAEAGPTLGRIARRWCVFALSCFGLLLFLWLSFGGPIPLKPKGYRVHVAFPEATQLANEADVRIAGVSVGKVRKKDIDPAQPNRTIATLELDDALRAAARRTPRAILRQKTLLGETYVELTPGDPQAAPTIPEDGTLPDAHVHEDRRARRDLPGARPATRTAFQNWQQTLAKASARPAAGRTSTTRSATCPASPRTPTDVLERARRAERRRCAASSRTRASCSARSPQNEASCTT